MMSTSHEEHLERLRTTPRVNLVEAQAVSNYRAALRAKKEAAKRLAIALNGHARELAYRDLEIADGSIRRTLRDLNEALSEAV